MAMSQEAIKEQQRRREAAEVLNNWRSGGHELAGQGGIVGRTKKEEEAAVLRGLQNKIILPKEQKVQFVKVSEDFSKILAPFRILVAGPSNSGIWTIP